MDYIMTIMNGKNTYSVFAKKKVHEGSVVLSYGICIENSTDAVYVPDITTVRDIALCMVKVISTDMIMPEKINDVIPHLVS
ncbi:MAG: hypothetical protein E7505_06490 [Ruminococcus sp.]|nr:hypothetical protein [Ruminococcus sp.]